MNPVKTMLTCLVGIAALIPLCAVAQAPDFKPFTFEFEGRGAHQSSSDLKDGGGAFDVDRWFLSAGVTYAWDFRNSVGFRVGGGRNIYSFDQDTGFGGGDPWGTAEDLRFSLPARFKVSERATAIIIPSLRYDREKGADMGDSDTYGVFAAVAWRLSDDLTIGPGIGWFSRLEESSRVFPILVIDWNITERWNLSTGRGLAATVGPGLTLSYRFNRYWSLAIDGRYEDFEFRLDDEGVAPGGVGRDQSFPLIVSGIVEPNDRTRFSLFTGVELGGQLKLKNAQGENIEESDYDPALLIGASFDVRF